MSRDDPHGAPSSGTSYILICLTARRSFRDVTLTWFGHAASLETLGEAPKAWTVTPTSSQWITRQAHGVFTVDRYYKQRGDAEPMPVRDGWRTSLRFRKHAITCTVVAPSSDDLASVTFEMSVELKGKAPTLTLIQP
jgi:hypothetical protein